MSPGCNWDTMAAKNIKKHCVFECLCPKSLNNLVFLNIYKLGRQRETMGTTTTTTITVPFHSGGWESEIPTLVCVLGAAS